MGKKSELASEYEHILKTDKNCIDKAFDFCEGYKTFINASKTERECVSEIINIVKTKGYKELNKDITKLNVGDKLYFNNRGKALVLITIGKESLDKGVNFVISHIDFQSSYIQ